MASRGVFWGGIAGSLLVGGVAGFVAGWYGGIQMTMAHYGDQWLYEQAHDIESRVAVLRALRTGREKAARRRLENELNDDLIAIRPDRQTGRRTVGEINKAVADAQAYRADFPYTSGHPKIDELVKKVFAEAPFKSAAN